MDDLLAGFGKLLGTLELGNVGNWVGGVISAVALLVAIGTQRRQLTQSISAEAMLVQVRKINAFGFTTFSVKSYSVKPLREIVAVVVGPTEPGVQLSGSWYGTRFIKGFPASTTLLTRPDRSEYHVKLEELGYLEEFFSRVYHVYSGRIRFRLFFTDSNGRRWVIDGESGRLRPHKGRRY